MEWEGVGALEWEVVVKKEDWWCNVEQIAGSSGVLGSAGNVSGMWGCGAVGLLSGMHGDVRWRGIVGSERTTRTEWMSESS